MITSKLTRKGGGFEPTNAEVKGKKLWVAGPTLSLDNRNIKKGQISFNYNYNAKLCNKKKWVLEWALEIKIGSMSAIL